MPPCPFLTGRTALGLSLVLLACTPPLPPRKLSAEASVPAAASSQAAPGTATIALDAGSSPSAPARAVRLKPALQPSALASIVWSRDGTSIATWCGPSCRWGPEHQRRVVVWSLPKLEVVADGSPNKDDMGEGRIHHVDFTPDGARLGTSTHNEVQLFDRDGWKLMTRKFFTGK
jgi:hypothetical protein